MKIAISLLLAVTIGVLCRLAGIPVPAPPALVGALLVVSMTAGYLVVDRIVAERLHAGHEET
ncbi:MAG TPA: DUF1427 family protein [Steroidobacteraceae bacterium]|nr:DUF1427 family protein [Steroidobacteraceae bacterium]